MSADAKASLAKPKFSFVEQSKKPRLALYDDQRKLWGFFMPDEAAMLKVRTPEQWCALGRRLWDEQASADRKTMIIPYESDDRSVRGQFVMVPGMGICRSLPKKLSRDELKAMRCDVEIPGESYTLEELYAKWDAEDVSESDKS